jgi:hypothetical protein
MDESERAPGLPSLPLCLLTLIENEEWIWNYCAESGTQPHFFVHVGRITYPIFVHYENKGVEIAVARPWVARCAAVVIAGDVHGLPAQQEIGKVY